VGFNLFAFYNKQLYSDSDKWATQHVKSRVFSTISSKVDFEETRMAAPKKNLAFGEYLIFLPSVKPTI
jgi:hypothetical protein